METMSHTKHPGMNPYVLFASMMLLSFVAMYVLMYAMVNEFANVYSSVNEFYMAGLMTAPMMAFEIVLMRHMYPMKGWNIAIGVGAIVLLIAFWCGIRSQAGVSDHQFLRSMIPHHAGAILMCQQANLHDPRVRSLCQQIIVSQQKEIDEMKALLREGR